MGERPAQLREQAAAMVRHVKGEVLHVPAQRAAVRAALGHTPGEPRTFGAYREIGAFLPEKPRFAEERAFLAVAAMMCAQPASNRQQDITAARGSDAEPGEDDGEADPEAAASLGASCATAVRRGRIAEKTVESRLHLLCRVDADGAHRQLPRLVHHLRGVGVPIDWAALIDDLSRWEHSRQRIAARWMRDFYRGKNQSRKPDETPEDPS